MFFHDFHFFDLFCRLLWMARVLWRWTEQYDNSLESTVDYQWLWVHRSSTDPRFLVPNGAMSLAAPITSNALATPGAAIGRIGVQQSQFIGLSLRCTNVLLVQTPRVVSLCLVVFLVWEDGNFQFTTYLGWSKKTWIHLGTTCSFTLPQP